MAIIGKETITIDNKQRTFKIRVLADGMFRTVIPADLVDHATDYQDLKRGVEYACDTKDELIKRLHDLRDKVKESSTTKHKVILYKIDVDCTVEGPARLREDYDPDRFKDPEEIVVLMRGQHHWSSGMKIDISAAVFIESRIESLDGTIRYSYHSNEVPRDECLPSGLYGNNLGRTYARTQRASGLLEWTQERHDFFVRIYEAMGQLAWQLEKLTEPENIDKAIKSGLKLFEGNNDDRKGIDDDEDNSRPE